MMTSAAMLALAAELTGTHAEGDVESLAAIAWQLYGEAGEEPQVAEAREHADRGLGAW